MRAAVVAATGIVAGLLGAGLILGGVAVLSSDSNPVGGLILIVLGGLAVTDGGRQWNVEYPKAKFRERVAALGNPVGLSLREIRRAIGRERDLQNTAAGCELTWRVAKLSLTLVFDADEKCTGIAAAKGVSPHSR